MKTWLMIVSTTIAAAASAGCCDNNKNNNNTDGGTGTDGSISGPTIAITGNTIDPERAVAARTGNLAALFGPADQTGPCWTAPCDNNEAFALSKVGGVRVSLLGHPEVSTMSNADGSFELKGVPQKSRVNLVLDKPGDTVYMPTIDAIAVRTGTVDLKNLPFHVCRNDKMFKALLDKEGPNAIDNGAVLAVINNNVPLPQNQLINLDVDVTAMGGTVDYVGFEYQQKRFVVDAESNMPSYNNAQWLGSVMVSKIMGGTVSVEVHDTTPTPDTVTGRPYTYPVYELPLQPKASTFLMLYPIGTM